MYNYQFGMCFGMCASAIQSGTLGVKNWYKQQYIIKQFIQKQCQDPNNNIKVTNNWFIAEV